IRSVEWDTLPRSAVALGDAGAIGESIDLVRGKIERINGELAALHVELALIDRVQPVPTNGVAPSLRPGLFLEGLGAVRKRRTDTVYAVRKKQYELYLANDELEQLAKRKALFGHTSDQEEEESSFLVTIDASDPGEAELEIIYAADWATWRPYYQLRIDPKE